MYTAEISITIHNEDFEFAFLLRFSYGSYVGDAEFKNCEPCCSKLCSISERCSQLDIIHISFLIIHLQVCLSPYTKTQLKSYLVPQDHELKKQYLALLPPQQIIEICLTFDIHVPPYVRSTIWPLDINAAIAALQKLMHNNENSRAEAPPAMGSLTVAGSASPSDEPAKPDEPQPPDKSASTSLQPQLGGQVNTQTPIPQPPYPYQQYGFHQPQSGYPHASYYGHPPPGYAPYPSPYPYQQFSLHPPPPTQPTPIQLPPPSQPQDAFRDQPAADDLPSYEEMIVEALTDCGDPEGCAPKELFMWMASRYPLQSNFRPSASQALQKAFKRGRFEKSRGGKYRLSATWEGGNVNSLLPMHALSLTQPRLHAEQHAVRKPIKINQSQVPV